MVWSVRVTALFSRVVKSALSNKSFVSQQHIKKKKLVWVDRIRQQCAQVNTLNTLYAAKSRSESLEYSRSKMCRRETSETAGFQVTRGFLLDPPLTGCYWFSVLWKCVKVRKPQSNLITLLLRNTFARRCLWPQATPLFKSLQLKLHPHQIREVRSPVYCRQRLAASL